MNTASDFTEEVTDRRDELCVLRAQRAFERVEAKAVRPSMPPFVVQ